MVKEKFSNFIERIFESSELQIAAGAIQKAFQEEIFLNADEIHKYIKNMKEVWNNWKSSSKTDFISHFIEETGDKIFLIWLSNIFNFEHKQIEIKCLRGPSSVDSLFEISYNYNKKELKIIVDLITKYNLDASEEDVARTIFIEAIKSISDILSKIINQSYNIFTSEVNIIKKKGTITIEYRGAGRVTE
ncbi:MAG: hypothetical protein ACTSQI_09940 [Candidatus Helarchaeota archaeon]